MARGGRGKSFDFEWFDWYFKIIYGFLSLFLNLKNLNNFFDLFLKGLEII
jgi:hypothetical protein